MTMVLLPSDAAVPGAFADAEAVAAGDADAELGVGEAASTFAGAAATELPANPSSAWAVANASLAEPSRLAGKPPSACCWPSSQVTTDWLSWPPAASTGIASPAVFTSPAQIAADSRVNQSIDGLERHALDLSGSRADNPFFVKEATGNTDYNQSDYAIKPDSPAAGSGKPLPVEIAQAIDPSGELVKPGVAVDRGALRNVRMNATDNSSMR